MGARALRHDHGRGDGRRLRAGGHRPGRAAGDRPRRRSTASAGPPRTAGRPHGPVAGDESCARGCRRRRCSGRRSTPTTPSPTAGARWSHPRPPPRPRGTPTTVGPPAAGGPVGPVAGRLRADRAGAGGAFRVSQRVLARRRSAKVESVNRGRVQPESESSSGAAGAGRARLGRGDAAGADANTDDHEVEPDRRQFTFRIGESPSRAMRSARSASRRRPAPRRPAARPGAV